MTQSLDLFQLISKSVSTLAQGDDKTLAVLQKLIVACEFGQLQSESVIKQLQSQIEKHHQYFKQLQAWKNRFAFNQSFKSSIPLSFQIFTTKRFPLTPTLPLNSLARFTLAEGRDLIAKKDVQELLENQRLKLKLALIQQRGVSWKDFKVQGHKVKFSKFGSDMWFVFSNEEWMVIKYDLSPLLKYSSLKSKLPPKSDQFFAKLAILLKFQTSKGFFQALKPEMFSDWILQYSEKDSSCMLTLSKDEWQFYLTVDNSQAQPRLESKNLLRIFHTNSLNLQKDLYVVNFGAQLSHVSMRPFSLRLQNDCLSADFILSQLNDLIKLQHLVNKQYHQKVPSDKILVQTSNMFIESSKCQIPLKAFLQGTHRPISLRQRYDNIAGQYKFQKYVQIINDQCNSNQLFPIQVTSRTFSAEDNWEKLHCQLKVTVPFLTTGTIDFKKHKNFRVDLQLGASQKFIKIMHGNVERKQFQIKSQDELRKYLKGSLRKGASLSEKRDSRYLVTVELK